MNIYIYMNVYMHMYVCLYVAACMYDGIKKADSYSDAETFVSDRDHKILPTGTSKLQNGRYDIGLHIDNEGKRPGKRPPALGSKKETHLAQKHVRWGPGSDHNSQSLDRRSCATRNDWQRSRDPRET